MIAHSCGDSMVGEVIRLISRQEASFADPGLAGPRWKKGRRNAQALGAWGRRKVSNILTIERMGDSILAWKPRSCSRRRPA